MPPIEDLPGEAVKDCLTPRIELHNLDDADARIVENTAKVLSIQCFRFVGQTSIARDVTPADATRVDISDQLRSDKAAATEVVTRLSAECDRLREAIAWAYQAIGGRWPNNEAMDNLSALSNGLQKPHEWMSVPPSEEAELREDKARLDWLCDEVNSALTDYIWDKAAQLCPVGWSEAEDTAKWARAAIDAERRAK